jgi:hypothetical protein
MDIHGKPIEERIDWLFGLAERHSGDLSQPGSLAGTRALSRRAPDGDRRPQVHGRPHQHPGGDQHPVGLLMPFRNLGGIFDLGWPHLGEVLAHHVQRVVSAGRNVVFLVTYHYSQGDPRRGCAGFQYDTAAAIAHTYEIRRQVEHIFGTDHGTVYPLVCGFETDEDALVIHGTAGDKLDLATLTAADRARSNCASPPCCPTCRHACAPICCRCCTAISNISRTCARRFAVNERLLDIEHREWMICLGRGFDFLHTPNIA